MGLSIPTLAIGAEVAGTVRISEDEGYGTSGRVVRMFADAVVVETDGGRRVYVPATEFDRWEVVSRPRYTLVDEGYL